MASLCLAGEAANSCPSDPGDPGDPRSGPDPSTRRCMGTDMFLSLLFFAYLPGALVLRDAFLWHLLCVLSLPPSLSLSPGVLNTSGELKT